MKTTNRVRRENGGKSVKPQSGKPRQNEPGQSPSAPAAIPVLINPAVAAANMVEALAAYRVRINEAGALALLLAAQIRTQVRDNAEWSEFDRHSGFADGVRELALTALARLSEQTDFYGIAHAGMVEVLRGLSAPVPPMPGDVQERQLLQKYGFDFGALQLIEFEYSKCTMVDFLDMAGSTLSERNGTQVGYSIAEAIANELDNAYHRVWKAAHALREAALAVEWQRAGERQAAA